MTEPNQLPATLLTQDGALTTAAKQCIVNRMAENVLEAVYAQERIVASQRRYRIGDYEFREPDHEQIQIWARMSRVSSEKIVEILTNSCAPEYLDSEWRFGFQVVEGVIVSMHRT